MQLNHIKLVLVLSTQIQNCKLENYSHEAFYCLNEKASNKQTFITSFNLSPLLPIITMHSAFERLES